MSDKLWTAAKTAKKETLPDFYFGDIVIGQNTIKVKMPPIDSMTAELSHHVVSAFINEKMENVDFKSMLFDVDKEVEEGGRTPKDSFRSHQTAKYQSVDLFCQYALDPEDDTPLVKDEEQAKRFWKMCENDAVLFSGVIELTNKAQGVERKTVKKK